MSEALNIEPTDFYEPPLLTEAGDFTDLTKGDDYPIAEGTQGRYLG